MSCNQPKTIPTTNTKKLTGRIRYRVDFFNNVILQVEVFRTRSTTDSLFNFKRFGWKDATQADFTELCAFHTELELFSKDILSEHNPWLTGNVFYKAAWFSDRVVLYVEEYDCTLTMHIAGYRKARSTDLAAMVGCLA